MKNGTMVVVFLIFAVGLFVAFYYFGGSNVTKWIENDENIDGEWRQTVYGTNKNGEIIQMPTDSLLDVYYNGEEVDSCTWNVDAFAYTPMGGNPWDNVEIDFSSAITKIRIETAEYEIDETLIRTENITVLPSSPTQTATSDIEIFNAPSVGSCKVNVTFDSSVFEVVEIVTTYSDFGSVYTTFDNNEGKISIISHDNSVSGDLLVATVTFERVGTGRCALHISDTLLADDTPQSMLLPHEKRDGIAIGDNLPPPDDYRLIDNDYAVIVPSIATFPPDTGYHNVITKTVDLDSFTTWEDGVQYQITFSVIGTVRFRGIDNSGATGPWTDISVNGIGVRINYEL